MMHRFILLVGYSVALYGLRASAEDMSVLPAAEAAKAEVEARAKMARTEVDAEIKGVVREVEAAAKAEGDAGLAALRAKAAAAKKDAEAKLVELNRAKAKADAAKAEMEKVVDQKGNADKAAKGKFVHKAAAGLFQQIFAPIIAPAPIAPARVNFEAVEAFDGGEIVVEGDFIAAPAIDGAPVVVPGELNQAEQQMFAHFQSMLPQQLAFAKHACQLNPEQLKVVSAAVTASLKATAKDYVKAANQPRKVVRINNVRQVQPAQPNPKVMLEKSILAALESAKLPEDVRARYTEELAKRDEFRKQACIEAFVGLIDERLVLDATQREKLAVAIAKNWDDNWAAYLDTLLYNNNFTPPVPNQIVLPILRKDQKEVWQSAMNQQNQGFFFGGAVLAR